jgi:MFS family permease
MSAFLARSDSILLSLFMVLWAYSFEPDDYNSAYMKASAYSGVSYAVIMFSCIVYGILLQRKKSTKLMFVSMLIFAAIGTLMINFITTMGSFILYIALGVLGLGMSGLLTSSLFLVNTYAPQEHRGYVTGIQTLVGILGITVQTFIGSLLLDKTGRNGPFNLFGGICVVMIPIALIVYRNKKSLDTQPEP